MWDAEIERYIESLPSWIHPALVQATLKKIQISTKTNSEIVLNWWKRNQPSLEEIKKIPQRAPSNSIKSLLSFLWLDKNDFTWKNVLDLGWWFWWVAANLEETAWYITVVDPVFWEKNLKKLLVENISSQERAINSREELIKNNSNIPKITKNSIETELVLDEMKWWLNYNPINNKNIERNASFWEKIDWVMDKSQDYVFCNYVLTKEIVKFEEVIKEIYRVLKNWWQLIYSDNILDEDEEKNKKIIEELTKYFEIEIKHKDKSKIIIICTKK